MSGSTDPARKREYDSRYYAEHRELINAQRRERYGREHVPFRRLGDDEATERLRLSALGGR